MRETINCGHYPLPQIPGVTIPQEKQHQSKEANDKEYQESQQQRALERSIRAAKRKQAAFKAAGLDDAAADMAQTIKDRQAAMRDFIKKTGRPRRYDRETLHFETKRSRNLGTSLAKKIDSTVVSGYNTEKQVSAAQLLSRKYKRFDTGKEVNDFFYYDDEKRGLLAKNKSKYKNWFNGLESEERESILDYTASGYGDINDYFRKRGAWQEINADWVKEKAKHIDSAISRFELKENITVQRGVMEDALDEIIEKYNISNNSELIGKVFHDEGYASTTVLSGNPVATEKPVLFEISVPSGVGRGAYINELSGFTDAEYEFLLKRGADYTITDVEEDIESGKIVVKMVMNIE